jgi:predicted esterase
MAPQKPIEIAPRGKHTATLIMAHGLGDTGLGWTFLAEQWRMQNKFDHVKFIFPNAPTRKITIVGPICYMAPNIGD